MEEGDADVQGTSPGSLLWSAAPLLAGTKLLCTMAVVGQSQPTSPSPGSTQRAASLQKSQNSYQGWDLTSTTLTSLLLCPRNITLLHYLITIVEKKYPKVLRLHEELRDIPQAAKVK